MGSLSQFEENVDPLLRGHLSAGKGVRGIGCFEGVKDADYFLHGFILPRFPLVFRTVAADDIWLSPFNGRDSATITVHQYAKLDYKPLFDLCEAIFRRYGGRPHWGKIHTATRAELASFYPHFESFCDLRRQLDPAGKFLNDQLGPLFG